MLDVPLQEAAMRLSGSSSGAGARRCVCGQRPPALPRGCPWEDAGPVGCGSRIPLQVLADDDTDSLRRNRLRLRPADVVRCGMFPERMGLRISNQVVRSGKVLFLMNNRTPLQRRASRSVEGFHRVGGPWGRYPRCIRKPSRNARLAPWRRQPRPWPASASRMSSAARSITRTACRRTAPPDAGDVRADVEMSVM
jgi:hypothetical protein